MNVAVALILTLQGSTIAVGQAGAYTTISEALAAARPYDTIRVAPGVYHEHPVIERPVVLLGEPGAVIEGDGRDVVLTIRAPATVRGFVIRGSGADQSREHAGILASNAFGLLVEDNRLEDVLFGVYVKQSDRVVIRRNDIVGKNLAVSLRGDGIRLWYSHDGRIEDNRVGRSRDIVIWFSNGTEVRGNRVSDGRYGLHYMYSNHNRFEDNQFLGNHVGAFIMYSEDITFRNNVFADAHGTTGRGLGFKDADRITAEGNVMVKNAVGISIDNSPHSESVTNFFRNNVIAYNDIGITLLPSVHSNVFVGNEFRDNVQPASVSGGGTARANHWSDNFWSDYAGFDANGDGRGDTPFVFERLSDDMFARYEPLQVFNLSLATTAMNVLSRVFPLLAPQPVLIDSAPRLEGRARPASRSTPGTRPWGSAAGFLLGAVLAITVGARLRHPIRSAT